ncbi:MAG: hypothetical protein ACE5ES_00995 [Candidatus Nanoarchaeia archaeon]
MLRVTDKQYWMDNYLKKELDTIVYNLPRDWDFVLGVSGDGMTRVGKSMLGQQIGYYVAHSLKTPFSVDNIVFSGDELIKLAHKLPKNSVIIYDEARAELSSKAAVKNLSTNLLDFFAECGMLNHLVILILPDFFELNKSLAVNRTSMLINVFRTSENKKLSNGNNVIELKRGHFEVYGPREKRKLYVVGKKQYDNYAVGKSLRNFYGQFMKYDIIDSEEYNTKKISFLKREKTNIQNDTLLRIKEVALNMTKQPDTKGLGKERICQLCGISRQTLYRYEKTVRLNHIDT